MVLTLEGGIGQQCFIYLYYLLLKEKNVCVELRMNESESRGYRLEEFGIEKQRVIREIGIESRLEKRLKVRLTSRLLFKLFPLALTEILKSSELTKVLKVDSLLKSAIMREFNKVYKQPIAESVFLHLRRGDFVTKGIRVIDYTEYIAVVLAIQSLYKVVHRDLVVLIASDSPLDELEIDIFEQHNIEYKFLHGFTDFQTHILMQNCGVLIASNSSFSLSAAFLRNPGSMTIIPKHFYSGHDGAHFDLMIGKLINYGFLSNNKSLNSS